MMGLKQFFCIHDYPDYYTAPKRGHVDGINRHHLYIHRECANCGNREYAYVHVPQAYVEAIDKVKGLTP